VPIVFKPNATPENLDQIAAILEKSLPPDSLIVESTDFSHYLTPAQAEIKDRTSRQVIENNGNALTLSQPDNIDSKAALYLEMKLQREFYSAKPQVLFHQNSQAYTKDPVTSSTSYFGVAYQAPSLIQYRAGAATTPDVPVKTVTTAPKTVTATSSDAELIFTGDVMLSRHIGEIMAQKKDYFFPFAQIAPTLQAADWVFGNLETPVSDGGKDAGHLYSFRSDPRALYGLVAAGYKGVSIANNHVFDYDREAFNDTLKNLTDAGIAYSGGGYNFSQAHAGATFNVNGTKITVLSYTDLLPTAQAATAKQAGYAYLDPVQMAKDIKAAKKTADLVIVSCHWGQEYKTHSNKHQQQLATAAVNAGADLVVGHHPHVPEEVTNINGVPVAYSLGNFIFDQNFSKDTSTGLILKVTIKDKKIAAVTPVTVHFNKSFQPYIADNK
jgi:poly-gamma-glutamate synthesis protein (capsule biosynthesis protein)